MRGVERHEAKRQGLRLVGRAAAFVIHDRAMSGVSRIDQPLAAPSA